MVLTHWEVFKYLNSLLEKLMVVFNLSGYMNLLSLLCINVRLLFLKDNFGFIFNKYSNIIILFVNQ